MAKLRSDIQALRGWAVGLVLLDHAQIGPFAQGYLGVDIFFVISGFLITGLIARDIKSGSFSFAEFYFRRVKRLLPAAYITIFLTSIAAIWFLTSLEMQDLTSQVFGALTWTINFVLLSQTDYFANSADLKPLLHMWSLAVEEQFYLVMPALLFFTPQRLWKLAFGVVLVASMALCLYWARTDPQAAFYMLPSRAWELAIGGIGALTADRWMRVARYALWPALLLLVGVPIWSTGYSHPGLDAALVCGATLAVILAKSEPFGRAGRFTGLCKIGDISYSLYLVHWPVIAFMNNAYMGPAPLSARLIGLLISAVLAWLLFALVEKPIHRSEKVRLSPRIVSIAASATVAIGALQLGVGAAAGNASWAYLRRPNIGLSKTCDRKPLENEACRTGMHPKILIWGDSYAMALVAGIVDSTSEPIVQATLSACPPIKGMAFHRPKRENPSDWAKRCIGFNNLVLDRIRQDKDITTIVMSSPWRDYDHIDVWTGPANNPVHQKASVERAIDGFKATIKLLRDLGKKVIVVGPPPDRRNTDVSLCVERLSTGKITFRSGCTIDSAAARELDRLPFEFLTEAKNIGDVSIVSLFDAMCNERVCLAQIDGHPLYRDGGHLSYEGSRVAVGRSTLPGLLQ